MQEIRKLPVKLIPDCLTIDRPAHTRPKDGMQTGWQKLLNQIIPDNRNYDQYLRRNVTARL
jgi:hypothetical protein